MTRPTVIGLTGSIGMGKSTTAEMFKKAGAAVWNADDAVHRLYSKGGAGAQVIAETYPEVIVNGAVDRQKLSDLINVDTDVLRHIERLIHPLVAEDRKEFLGATSKNVVVLDVPLLFETGLYEHVDLVVVVSVSKDEQRSRVLERPNMTPEKFETILAKQTPDAEKRAKANYIIDTSSLETARRDVHLVMEKIGQAASNA